MHTLDLSGCIELLTTDGTTPAGIDFVLPVLEAQKVHGGVRELLLSTPASWAPGHGFAAFSVSRVIDRAPNLTRLNCAVQVVSRNSGPRPPLLFGPSSRRFDPVYRRLRKSFLKDLAVDYDAEHGYDGGCDLMRAIASISQLETLFLRHVLRLDVRFLFPLSSLSKLTLVSCDLTEDALPSLAHLVGRLSSLSVSTSPQEFAASGRALFGGAYVSEFAEAVRLSSLQELRLFANGQRLWDVVGACAGHPTLRVLHVDAMELLFDGTPLTALVPVRSALVELVLKPQCVPWETTHGFFEAVARSQTLRKLEIGACSRIVDAEGGITFYGPDEAFEEDVIVRELCNNTSLDDVEGLLQERPWRDRR
jgi:hypothetical protein